MSPAIFPVPVKTLYNNNLSVTIQCALHQVSTSNLNGEDIKLFFNAHIYHHGLGHIKHNGMMANALYERAINATTNLTVKIIAYYALGCLNYCNILHQPDFEKAARYFEQAISLCDKDCSNFGFMALIMRVKLQNEKNIPYVAPSTSLSLLAEYASELCQSSDPMVSTEIAKQYLYDKNPENFRLGRIILKHLADNNPTADSLAVYSMVFLHGIIPSNIVAPADPHFNYMKRFKNAFKYALKGLEYPNGGFINLNFASYLLKLDELYYEEKISKSDLIKLYNFTSKKAVSNDIDENQLVQNLLRLSLHSCQNTPKEYEGTSNIILQSLYLRLSFHAITRNHLNDHLKYYSLHLQVRNECLHDKTFEQYVRDEDYISAIESFQESWRSDVEGADLAERKKAVLSYQKGLNTHLLSVSNNISSTPQNSIASLFENLLSEQHVNSTSSVNIATVTTLLGRLFAEQTFKPQVFVQNMDNIHRLCELILQRIPNFGAREARNIFCGLSKFQLTNVKLYRKAVDAMLSEFIEIAQSSDTSDICFYNTSYLCDLLHSISRIKPQNHVISLHLEFIMEQTANHLCNLDVEDKINVLYPLAKIHACLPDSDIKNKFFTLLTEHLNSLNKAFNHETLFNSAHQWYLLLQYVRCTANIPEDKDVLLKKCPADFKTLFTDFPVNADTTMSKLQYEVTQSICKTLQPYLENANFNVEKVINGLPCDLVIYVPNKKIRGAMTCIPIQIHGPGHYFYPQDQRLLKINKEAMHDTLLNRPVVISYKDWEHYQDKPKEWLQFLQKVFKPHYHLKVDDEWAQQSSKVSNVTLT